jgi:asparagine synthase (glutamine-hydrolysing)
LVHYVVAKHGILPLPIVARLTGVSPLDIMAALEERLRSYPEERLEDKHIHFVFFERGFKWLFEGEDRNRNFFWSTSPFYAPDTFRLAMKCPARFKTKYFLYRLFIEALSPSLIDVESTTWGPSLKLRRRPLDQLRQTLRRWSPQVVRRSWRRLTRPSVSTATLDCLRAQLAPSSSVAAYLSVSYANTLLGHLEPTQAYMLLTLSSAIEYLTTSHSTLERYHDIQFT